MIAAVRSLALLIALCASAFAADVRTLPLIPDPTLTSTQWRSDITPEEICTTKWGTDRRFVTEKMKRDVFASYHLSPTDRLCRPDGHHKTRFEIDHDGPRSLGGMDVVKNLWPQCFSGKWGAPKKDRLEADAHRKFCNGPRTREALDAARALFDGDWRESYRKIFGEPKEKK